MTGDDDDDDDDNDGFGDDYDDNDGGGGGVDRVSSVIETISKQSTFTVKQQLELELIKTATQKPHKA